MSTRKLYHTLSKQAFANAEALSAVQAVAELQFTEKSAARVIKSVYGIERNGWGEYPVRDSSKTLRRPTSAVDCLLILLANAADMGEAVRAGTY